MVLSKVAVLGPDGVTGKAVISACERVGLIVSDISDADLIVTSPGIPPEKYPHTNVDIISEIEFAYRLMKFKGDQSELIAVTGTNGKSTVTSLVAHFLGCPVAGNIGIPLVNYVSAKEPLISLELSSYQLELVPQFTPNIAILLNITPDHLSRHKTMERYVDAKASITRNQGANDVLIYNEKDPYCVKIAAQSNARCIPVSDEHPLAALQSLSTLKGPHNALNVAAASLVAVEYGKSKAELKRLISSFQPLPHRMEPVPSSLPYEFINDSKATNPESVEMAIKGFEQPVHLLLCGKDKGLELESFIRQCHESVTSIITFGDISEKIVQISTHLNPAFPVVRVSTMQEAVMSAVKGASKGDIILLSPSSESFDQFTNFEDRGEQFKEIVSGV
jgi:UDP-N-acetylmuramoylalanine--D-glutamate ligase